MKALLAVLLAAACARPADKVVRDMPDVRLETAAGAAAPSLASCATDKCLTVLVAPWCGVCRAEAPNIGQFRRWLKARGVDSRVVVGLSDDRAAEVAFAARFGPDSLIDPAGALASRETPLFLVSDRHGRILRVIEGFPSHTRGPEDFARLLGLIS